MPVIYPAFYGTARYGYSYYGITYGQYAYFRVISGGVAFSDLPFVSAKVKKNALDLSGSYELQMPNIRGVGLNKFDHYETQELYFYDLQTAALVKAMEGQVNRLNYSNKHLVQIEGRGLNGYLTDKKANEAYVERRGDYIICDPTYGLIPLNYTNITTWNGFTDDYDQFTSWSTTRWGAQPAYCVINSGVMEFTGNGGANRWLEATGTEYNYEVIEFYAKVSAASSNVYFGFTNSAHTQYVRFRLSAANVHGQTADGVGTQSTATVSAITQTNYHYYRIEWAENSARFFIDGELEVEVTLNVPTGTLHPFMCMATTAETSYYDYMKVIALTKLFDAYVTKQKLIIDVVKEICDVGNSTTAFSFYVDDDLDFNAYIKQSIPSGKTYGFNSLIYNSTYQKISQIQLNEEAKDLYNIVRIEGGEMLTEVAAPTWVDQFIGNGSTTSYILGYKAQKPMTLVEVNGGAVVEDTDYTMTYGKDSSVIKFNTAPGAGHTINIRYNYYTPIIATVRNDASIAAYGLERVYSKKDETILSEDRARSYARALLAYYSDPRTVITITIVLDPTIDVAQTVMVDAPDRGITDTLYEIIEYEHNMAGASWTTKLTLANTDINTSAEIIREILQQLKDLKTKGDTNEVVTEEYLLPETAGLEELLEYKVRDIGTSWVWGITSRWGYTKWGERAGAWSAWTSLP